MKKLSQKGLELLTELEGLILHPYLDTRGIPTIGIGNTFYENGTKVTMNDKPISKEEAYHLFYLIAPKFDKPLNKVLPSDLNQNQFDALFCFIYNVGEPRFLKSTLLRRVLNNPNDKGGITEAFLMWRGKKDILLSRQKKQINRYFL